MPSTTRVRGWTVRKWYNRIIITKMCGDSCVAMQAEFRNNTIVVRAVQGPINVMPNVIANLGDLQAVVALCAAHPGWRSLPVVDEYGCPLV